MTKLDRIPTRHELARLRERWNREDQEDVPLQDFDTTLTSGIDDTISHLKIIGNGYASDVEQNNLNLKAFEELRGESKQLREALAGIVTTLNRKASKSALARFEKNFAAKSDKRIDNLFKLVTFLGVVIGAIVALVKGH